jgi:hypothetical protein
LLVSGRVGARPRAKTDERSNRESETTKGEGEMSTLFPLFLTPHF